MTNRKQANLEQLSDLHQIYRQSDNGAELSGGCLAFVLDKRFMPDREIELRLGVSYGDNIFSTTRKPCFLPDPVVPGKFAFVLHVIGTRGDRMCIFDQNFDAFEAGVYDDISDAEKKAMSILESIDDEKYSHLVEDGFGGRSPLQISDRYLLEDFELVLDEQL